MLNIYLPLWSDELSWEENNSTLANIPEYVDFVSLSFIRPDGVFIDLDQPMNTLFYDLELPLSVIKNEVAESKRRNPNRRIIASCGGEIGGNFLNVNYRDLVRGVVELGLDGIIIVFNFYLFILLSLLLFLGDVSFTCHLFVEVILCIHIYRHALTQTSIQIRTDTGAWIRSETRAYRDTDRHASTDTFTHTHTHART